MAVDTADKRASAIGFVLAFRLVFPAPDAAVENQGDRQQLAASYRGLLAGSPLAAFVHGYITRSLFTRLVDGSLVRARTVGGSIEDISDE